MIDDRPWGEATTVTSTEERELEQETPPRSSEEDVVVSDVCDENK
jgi:hypothetical protein